MPAPARKEVNRETFILSSLIKLVPKQTGRRRQSDGKAPRAKAPPVRAASAGGRCAAVQSALVFRRGWAAGARASFRGTCLRFQLPQAPLHSSYIFSL